MPLLLLLFLTIPCLVETWSAPGEGVAGPIWVGGPLIVVVLTWMGVVIEVLFAAVVAWRTRRALLAGKVSRDRVLKSYLRGRWYHTLGLFLTYGLGLYLFGYGWAIHQLWSGGGEAVA